MSRWFSTTVCYSLYYQPTVHFEKFLRGLVSLFLGWHICLSTMVLFIAAFLLGLLLMFHIFLRKQLQIRFIPNVLIISLYITSFICELDIYFFPVSSRSHTYFFKMPLQLHHVENFNGVPYGLFLGPKVSLLLPL